MGSQATPQPEGDVFTEHVPGDNYLWTSGFLNERFPQPVSPLGWSLIRGLLEELAFRDPLRYLGYGAAERLPITRLWRGHPYVNVAVFQILYRPFPDRLLPEDAARYFPGGDTSLRRQAPYPRTLLDPRPRAALFFTDYSLGLLGLRDGPWKCIHEVEAGRTKLFDLRADPGEMHDVSARFPEETEGYRRRLLGWSASRRESLRRAAGERLP